MGEGDGGPSLPVSAGLWCARVQLRAFCSCVWSGRAHWWGNNVFLWRDYSRVQSELGCFCALNRMRGPLMVCQPLRFQKDKGVQHTRRVVRLMVIRHHANWKESTSGKYHWKTEKADMIQLLKQTGCLESFQNGTTSVWLSFRLLCPQRFPGPREKKWGVRGGEAANFWREKDNKWVCHYLSIWLKH